MSILIAILGAMGVIGAILWRMSQMADAAKGIVETADTAGGLLRRWHWQRKFAASTLDMVEDPREAAVAMMVATAGADGAMTERERRVILRLIVETFDATGEQAEELLAHGRWLTKDCSDLGTVLRKLGAKVRAKIGPNERAQLIDMVEAVATAEGPTAAAECQAIDALKRQLAG